MDQILGRFPVIQLMARALHRAALIPALVHNFFYNLDVFLRVAAAVAGIAFGAEVRELLFPKPQGRGIAAHDLGYLIGVVIAFGILFH